MRINDERLGQGGKGGCDSYCLPKKGDPPKVEGLLRLCALAGHNGDPAKRSPNMLHPFRPLPPPSHMEATSRT
ncbi:hypothetical protein NPIL_542121 [Nephila pilipes]|uniref:Uncharacterized protein n=1 Tax=Nephila pilipes TaxID=299642 RepID=A0A8X6P856_NEPPI|nr:hypothetical protein NPIL_542121 [Nephila pilipes]